MKFTQEEARKDLTTAFKTKYKDLDLERTIKECVENAFKMIGEDNDTLELADFVKLVQPTVQTAIGFMLHETKKVADEKDAEITKLKEGKGEGSGEGEGKGKGEGEGKGDGEGKTDPKLQEALDRIKKLEDEKAKTEESALIAQKRKDLFEKIKADVKDDDEWINDTLDIALITKDTDVDTEAEKFVTMYNKHHSDTPKNVTPKSSGDGGDGVSDKLKDVLGGAKDIIKQSLSYGQETPVVGGGEGK
jgi:hypothetical protein